MRILLLLFSFSLLNNPSIWTHGGHMATYHYHWQEDHIALEFQIEQSVLAHVDLTDVCDNYASATALCLSNYIQSHSQLSYQGKAIVFDLDGAKKTRDLYVIDMIAMGHFPQQDSLELSNRCFLEYDPEFENRIIIQRNHETRSYRLDAEHSHLIIP